MRLISSFAPSRIWLINSSSPLKAGVQSAGDSPITVHEPLHSVPQFHTSSIAKLVSIFNKIPLSKNCLNSNSKKCIICKLSFLKKTSIISYFLGSNQLRPTFYPLLNPFLTIMKKNLFTLIHIHNMRFHIPLKKQAT